MRKHRYNRFTPKQIETAVHLFKLGRSSKDISNIIGMSESGVSYLLTQELNERVFFGHYSTKGSINLNASNKEPYYLSEDEMTIPEYRPEDLDGEELAIYKTMI